MYDPNPYRINYEYAEDRLETAVGKLYLQYLDSLVDFDQWWSICKYLHAIDFYWTVDGDENREADGRQLRLDFEMGTHCYDYSGIEGGPASCLEVMIGLAIRMADEVDSPTHELTSEMFHNLLNNLGLSIYRDDVRYDIESQHSSFDIIRKWLDREYKPDGKGGLFPMRCPYGDMRNSELWAQMGGWIEENYPFL